MKIVFFGTPYYVVPILEALHKSFKEQTGESPVAAVVTQPPKPTGRKQILEYSAVDKWAHPKNISVFFDPQQLLESKTKADVGVLASYGELIPQDVIDIFKYGILVIHPSLLPKFRWGSPVPAAIVTGTNPTGCTIIKMDDKWDHGPIITQFKEEVLPEDTYESLRDRLFLRSAEVIVQMLPAYLKGKINIKKQDESEASFAKIIKKEDAYLKPKYLENALKGKTATGIWKIEFLKDYEVKPTPITIERFIRAMYPWPIAWTTISVNSLELRLKIIRAHMENEKLVIDAVQLEGKNPVSWPEFIRGYPNTKFS